MRIRKSLGLALALVCLAGLASHVSADEKKKKEKKPDATLKLSAKSVAAGVGWSWGGGTLTYQGKSHDVEVDGLTVGQVGAASIDAVGSVYHLKKLEDFNGTYTAVAGGATIGGGGGGLVMQNANGVEVTMHATTQGVSLTAGASGVKLSLK
jgi:hypothetical protein